MPITEYPQPMQKNTLAYINAGTTYTGSYTTGVSGTVSLGAPNQNIAGSTNAGSGYSKVVLSGNATLSWNVATMPSTYAHKWYLEISNPSTYTVTWTGITWHAGTAPGQATTARSIYEFLSPDGGTTIYGRQVMSNLAGTN